MDVKTADVEIRNQEGVQTGTLRIAVLDGGRAAPLWEATEPGDSTDALERVQVVEGHEYLYEFDLLGGGEVRTDRDEIFQRDEVGGKRGRLRPAEHVGLLPFNLFVDGVLHGAGSLEVRSRKLDYMRHYRWMLRDIATTAAGILSERFAPTQAMFEPEATDDPSTLYQQFAFLYSFITGPQFEAALAQVLSRPHRAWFEVEEKRDPSQGLRSGSALLRKLVSPGPRREWIGAADSPLTSLPQAVHTSRSEETVDTAENRFVRFALEHWRAVVDGVREVARGWKDTPSRRRAMLETAESLDVLDAALGQELFREVGPLRRFPASSSVLNRREGYREMFFAYLQSEIAAGLRWEGGEDVFGAGLRDVATLYEYWTFLQMVEVVRELCPHSDLGELIELSPDHMSLNLRRNRSVVVRGTLARLGRQLDLSLFFNKTFSPRSPGPLDGSWSAPLRPDCSLRVTLLPGTGAPSDVVWLHFDAKYRIEKVREVFGRSIESEEDEVAELEDQEASEVRGSYKVADLLKMHAYLAAIRRATGAYVLYPGSEAKTFERYREILPGLGAFPLSPSETGSAEGASAVAAFVDAACTHLANQATEEERSRYWTRVVYEQKAGPPKVQRALSFLEKPPADTPVLITPVLEQEEYDWMRSHRLFVLSDEVAEASAIPLSAFGADVLLARSATTTTAWRVEPFRLRFVGEAGDLPPGWRPGRLALQLMQGPFHIEPLAFPAHGEDKLLAGRLGEFLGSKLPTS